MIDESILKLDPENFFLDKESKEILGKFLIVRFDIRKRQHQF